MEYELVVQQEADAINGKISINSPVGQHLLGAKEGATCTTKTPSGVMEYKVIEIRSLT